MQQSRGRSIALISASIVLGALLALAGGQHGELWAGSRCSRSPC
ncbi:hypothetical protein AB3K78_11555 [Leucobacter sp. HNU]